MSENSCVTDRDILQALTTLEVNYWYEVDHNWGRNARAFYTRRAPSRLATDNERPRCHS